MDGKYTGEKRPVVCMGRRWIAAGHADGTGAGGYLSFLCGRRIQAMSVGMPRRE